MSTTSDVSPNMAPFWHPLSSQFTERRIDWETIRVPPPIPVNQAPVIVNTVMKFTVVHANGMPVNLSRIVFDAIGFAYNPRRFCADILPSCWPYSTMLWFHGGQIVLQAASYLCGVLHALMFVNRLNQKIYPGHSPYKILRNSCQTVNIVSKIMFSGQMLNTRAYQQAFETLFNVKDKFKKTYGINMGRRTEGITKKRSKKDEKKVVVAASQRAIVCTGLRDIDEQQRFMFLAWALVHPYLIPCDDENPSK